jgi:6-pyruvoyltetrahydropterin/6-carboxytetrahydropterin synthase
MESYIYINGWKEKIRFSSAHVIPEYKKCGRLHGHTYAVHIKLYGEPDSKGIILDFSIIKEILINIINKLDHKILIPKDSKLAKIKIDKNFIIMNTLGKSYNFPKDDCILLPIDSTSAEKLSLFILKKFNKNIRKYDNIKKIELGVDEGFGKGARVLINLNKRDK